MADVTAAGSECWLIPHGLSLTAARKSDPAITVVDGAGLVWRHSLPTGPPLQGHTRSGVLWQSPLHPSGT